MTSIVIALVIVVGTRGMSAVLAPAVRRCSGASGPARRRRPADLCPDHGVQHGRAGRGPDPDPGVSGLRGRTAYGHGDGAVAQRGGDVARLHHLRAQRAGGVAVGPAHAGGGGTARAGRGVVRPRTGSPSAVVAVRGLSGLRRGDDAVCTTPHRARPAPA